MVEKIYIKFPADVLIAFRIDRKAILTDVRKRLLSSDVSNYEQLIVAESYLSAQVDLLDILLVGYDDFVK